MAAMNQERIEAMNATINNASQNYVEKVKEAANKLAVTFNENWVSGSSRALAEEIVKCLDSLANAVTKTFDERSQAIASVIRDTNAVERENITFGGFTFPKPDTSIQVNNTLPSGHVGVADNADLSTINTPMVNMVSEISGILDGIVSSVQQSEAFDAKTVSDLANSMVTIKNKFKTEMDALAQSLKDRMSGEIEERNALNAKNSAQLQG